MARVVIRVLSRPSEFGSLVRWLGPRLAIAGFSLAEEHADHGSVDVVVLLLGRTYADPSDPTPGLSPTERAWVRALEQGSDIFVFSHPRSEMEEAAARFHDRVVNFEQEAIPRLSGDVRHDIELVTQRLSAAFAHLLDPVVTPTREEIRHEHLVERALRSPQVLDFMRRGIQIGAMKSMRDLTGCSLLEAKAVVEDERLQVYVPLKPRKAQPSGEDGPGDGAAADTSSASDPSVEASVPLFLVFAVLFAVLAWLHSVSAVSEADLAGEVREVFVGDGDFFDIEGTGTLDDDELGEVECARALVTQQFLCLGEIQGPSGQQGSRTLVVTGDHGPYAWDDYDEVRVARVPNSARADAWRAFRVDNYAELLGNLGEDEMGSLIAEAHSQGDLTRLTTLDPEVKIKDARAWSCQPDSSAQRVACSAVFDTRDGARHELRLRFDPSSAVGDEPEPLTTFRLPEVGDLTWAAAAEQGPGE